jgi:prepilin-type N-terminal cleavage/methylation domain-containing protein
MRRRRKHDNRGFTLVELVVVTAILAIVGAAVAGFLAVSTRSYKSVSSEVDLQTEAQVAMNQFQTLLMNAEAGVNFSEKTIEIYNAKSRYVITWDEDAQRLYYKEEARKVDAVSGAYTTEFEELEGEGSLFAEYVDDFSATVNTSGKTIIVNISLHFTRGDRSYQASEDISLRNTVLINEELSTIYDGELSGAATVTYSGITVSLGNMSFSNETQGAYSVSLEGADVTIPLSVTILGHGFPSQEYTCTFVDGDGTEMQSTSAGSSVGAGNVVIAASETASSLTLKVASKIAPSINCTVAINIAKTETAPEETPTENPGLYLSCNATVTRGSSVQILAKKYNTDTSECYSPNEVHWSVDVYSNSSDGSRVSISQNGILTVPKDLDYNNGFSIVVRAYVIADPSLSANWEKWIPTVSVGFSTDVNGYYNGWYELSLAYMKSGESVSVYYQVTGVENGVITGFQWKNKDGTNLTEEFSQTVSIQGDNTITFTKTDGTFSGRSYNSIFKFMTGTPIVDGQVISSSGININNTPVSNVDIGGNGYDYNYYIPVAETNGWVKLEDTDYWYQVSYVTIVYNEWYSESYYQLIVSEDPNANSKIYYKVYSTESWARWAKIN